MNRMTSGAAILAALMSVAPQSVAAQQGPRMGRGPGMAPGGMGVEMILRQREQLELTADQVRQLDQIRQEAVQRRTAHQAEMAELRSKVLAGDLKVEDLRAQVEARREAAAEVQKQQQDRIQALLTDAQKEKIENARGRARAFMMGRQSALRGHRPGAVGGAGFRGWMPGMHRAPGGWDAFGPGMRQRMLPGPQGRFFGRRGPGGGLGFGPPEDSVPPA